MYMKNDFFARSNWKMIAGLLTLLALLIINGIFGLHSLTQSQQKAARYTGATAGVKDVQSLFLKQIRTWKNLLLSKGFAADYRAYYYEFSRYTALIQDALFNLQMSLDGHGEIESQLKETRALLGALSEQYVSLIFEMERTRDALDTDPAAIMHDREEDAISRMECIVNAINELSAREITRGNTYYMVMVSLSLALLVMLSLFMIASIIIENRTMQKRILRIGDRLNSYLPPQLARSIMRNDDQVGSATARKHITVCFTDLQGFTAMTECLPPETTSHVLNEYLSAMTRIAHAWGGLVDKFMGDGIMIVFGAIDDFSETSQARRCAGMAVEMQNTMKSLGDGWRSEGIGYSLKLRIGMNAGVATVGTFGPDDRKVFTAIGSVVNIASRLEHLCSIDKILLSEQARILVGESFRCRDVGTRSVKGIAGEVRVFEMSPESALNFKAAQFKEN
jgi:class 3 adenylate cyclase